MTAPRTFSEFMCDKVGARWVIASRLTDRLRRAGYEVAVSKGHYRELEIEWERETYGAPLASLREAAPAMLETLRMLLTHMKSARQHNCPPDNYALAAAEAAIRNAEGAQ